MRDAVRAVPLAGARVTSDDGRRREEGGGCVPTSRSHIFPFVRFSEFYAVVIESVFWYWYYVDRSQLS